jgi:hypothetical protein
MGAGDQFWWARWPISNGKTNGRMLPSSWHKCATIEEFETLKKFEGWQIQMLGGDQRGAADLTPNFSPSALF